LVALGLQIADPIVGLAITLIILHITWESWPTSAGTDGKTADSVVARDRSSAQRFDAQSYNLSDRYITMYSFAGQSVVIVATG
jgi:hypothetical protein